MTRRIAGTFEALGVPVNGATVKLWSGLAATPVKDTAIAALAGLGGTQVGGTVTSGVAFGGDGGYEFDAVTAAGEYHVSVEYGGHVVYQAVTRPLLPGIAETVTAAWTFSNAVTAPGITQAGTLTIGATGANQLLLQTNAVTRLTVTSAGAATFSGTLTASGLLTASAGLAVVGAVTVSTTLAVTGATTMAGLTTSAQINANSGIQATYMVATSLITGIADMLLSSAAPRLILHDTAAGPDLKRWDWRATGSALSLRMLSDASIATNVLVFTRTGTYLTGTLSIPAAITLTTVTGAIYAVDGLRTKIKAGAITDADFTSPAAGHIAIDETNQLLMVRDTAGNWHGIPYP